MERVHRRRKCEDNRDEDGKELDDVVTEHTIDQDVEHAEARAGREALNTEYSPPRERCYPK
eukprot:scaffold41744_cov62-Phaeocystis_antarctica.AAC.2